MHIPRKNIRLDRVITFASSLIFVCSCVSIPKSNSAWDSIFAGKEGCFLLYDLNSKAYADAYNPDFCKRQQPPLSTFKNSPCRHGFRLKSFEKRELDFEMVGRKGNYSRVESGSKRDDLDGQFCHLVFAEIDEIPWQVEDPRLSEVFWIRQRRLQRTLGQRLAHAGALCERPSEKQSSHLSRRTNCISGKFWTYHLPVKRSAIEEAQKILYLEETLKSYRWSGKTGSGFIDKAFKRRLGWFVAYVEGHNRRYLLVLNFQDKVDQAAAGFGGSEAKAMATKIMTSKGLH